MANRKGVEGDGDKLYANGGYSMVPLILEPGDSLLRNVLTMKGSDQEVATLHSATQNDPFVQSTPVCHVQSRRHLYTWCRDAPYFAQTALKITFAKMACFA
jgi:hypothetical protein